ncbi:MAG TPA: HAMP domain-containing sensor histidine kinase [Gemmatimonadaceae bacterium]|jgi:signal transduction histidine kinase|nr:HAMP domain-containing sensor histidine kinase [Gemmatimonadaceae bacterium]
MASIRAQLTAAYAAALLTTVAVFAAISYATTLSADRTARQHAVEQYVASEADLLLRTVEQAEASGEPLVTYTTVIINKKLDSIPNVTPKLRTVLEGVPDYALVLDAKGRTLYNSFAFRQLDQDDQVALSQAALALRADTFPPATVQLRSRQLLVMARSVPSAGPITRVVAGSEAKDEGVAPIALGSAIFIAAPIIVLISIGAAYVIAGRAFRPVDGIINEVEAITDGRSLHRRLALDGSGDELTRLTRTLNAMIERLETSFAALRRFTADASHELKTPLTVMRADVEHAMAVPNASTEQLEPLEEALREVRRMSDLVDSLLTLARADEGRFDLIREPVPLEPLVREVYETAVILGEDAGISVYLPVLEDVTVSGDPTRLRQLFLNLVTNAIKYTPRDGRVDLSLSKRLDAITFTVRDSGIGIAANDLPHIFDRFWRADRVRSRASERGGFGLGLAIAQYIAHAHGGSLTVSSRLGRGSVFTVTLPIDLSNS